jgi:hypothetical protein
MNFIRQEPGGKTTATVAETAGVKESTFALLAGRGKG